MRKKPTTKAGKKAKMSKVMDEAKAGKLRSGSRDGPKVTNPKQAIAIGLSESGQSKRGSKAGASSDRKKGEKKPKLEDVTF